jgi:hypothetical protein
MITRKGKIAHLPATVRQEINRLLYDGQTGKQILRWLKSQKAPGAGEVSEQNLSEWRKGGYQDWLKSEGQMIHIRERSELSLRMAQAAGGSLGESMVTRLAGRIDERLDAMGDDERGDLKPLLDVVLAAEKLKLERRKVDQKDSELELARAKFQRETADLFLKFYADKRAKEIASSDAGTEDKMQSLITLMFGTPPQKPSGAAS